MGGIVLAGLGGVLTIAAAVTGGIAMSTAGELEDACPADRCPDAEADRVESLRTLSITTDVLWPLGAALAIAGVIWVAVELSEMELTGTQNSGVPDCLSGTSRDFAFNAVEPVGHQLEISVHGPAGTIPRLVSSISAAGVCLPTLFRCRGESSARCRGMVVQPSAEGSPTSDLVRFFVAEVGAPPSGAPLTLRLHVIPLQDCSAGNPNYCEEIPD